MAPESPASEIHLHNPSLTKNPKRAYIVFFITGNPGLIEYYRTFLTHIYGSLTSSSFSSLGSTAFHVYGRSLSGFEASLAFKTAKSDHEGHLPFSLQEQISKAQDELENLVREVKRVQGTQDVRVILMGHSVGSYILLEVTRRLREKAKKEKDAVMVVGGVCLFPTVMHIAKSDSGKKATVSVPSHLSQTVWALLVSANLHVLKPQQLYRPANSTKPLFNIPHFALGVSILAKALTFFIPLSFLTFLIQKFMSFPADAAHITASFVKSSHGVRQALHMARDEMREITADPWDNDIWGASDPSTHPHPRPILRFLFAKKDHWVADETRDELMKVRGRLGDDPGDEVWKPKMEVDVEEGWVHGFCIKQSIPVAGRVSEWLRDIVQKDLEQ